MQKLTIEQCVKVVEAYYVQTNGRSHKNTFCALCEFFGQRNRPIESAIGKIVCKFKTVADEKTPLRARLCRCSLND